MSETRQSCGKDSRLEFENKAPTPDSRNTDFDPLPGKHVGLVRDSIRNHLAYAEDRRPWDGEWHELEVHVTLDGLTVWLDRELIIEWTDQGLLPFEGYVGFTAGTGGAQERYEIDVWVVDVDRP